MASGKNECISRMDIFVNTERGFDFRIEADTVPPIGSFLNIPGPGGEHRLVCRKVSFDYKPGVDGILEVKRVFISADYR